MLGKEKKLCNACKKEKLACTFYKVPYKTYCSHCYYSWSKGLRLRGNTWWGERPSLKKNYKKNAPKKRIRVKLTNDERSYLNIVIGTTPWAEDYLPD